MNTTVLIMVALIYIPTAIGIMMVLGAVSLEILDILRRELR